jgi:hypothetical protein
VFVFSFVKIKKRTAAVPSAHGQYLERSTCSLWRAGTAPRLRAQASLLASGDLTKAGARRLLFKQGLRALCVAILIAASACGPFGGAPDRGPGAGGVGAGHAAATPTPRRTPAAAAVLLQLVSPNSYGISLVFDDGHVVGPVTARLRTVTAPLTGSTPATMPVFSTSDSRLYYLDGDGEVRYLDRDGGRASAARVPGGPHAQSGFAVSPDDRRIAVAAVDYSSSPPTTRLYVEDVAGGANHLELPFPVGANVWPVGWHGGELVVAIGSAPTQSVPGNPYGTFAGYQLIDATTGGRLSSLACDPAGALTPAGSACLAGGAPLQVQDFVGRTRSLGGSAPGSVVSAAEAPDGAHVAFCCADGQLQLWDVAEGSVASLGPAENPDYGWIDATHLLVSDRPTQHPRVIDVTAGTSLPAAVGQGRVVARVPGAL